MEDVSNDDHMRFDEAGTEIDLKASWEAAKAAAAQKTARVISADRIADIRRKAGGNR